jgi:hypothetical protein
MSVYKEAIMGLEHINKNSKFIYSDSCDFGAPTKKGDVTWNWVKQLVEMYGIEGTRHEQKYLTGTTVSHIIGFVSNEHERGEYHRAKLTYVTTRAGDMDGYVYVEYI